MTNLDYHNSGYDEPVRVADYTNRSNYQKNYAKSNREAINARKREWRKMKKTVLPKIEITKPEEGEMKITVSKNVKPGIYELVLTGSDGKEMVVTKVEVV